MTTPGTGSHPDDHWRRPDPAAAGPATEPATTPPAHPGHGGVPGHPEPGPGYAGPPPTTRPPTGWRPPVHVQAPPPRRLPPQDMAELDLAEQRAERLTRGIGMAVVVILVVLVCLLCSRLLR